MEKMEIFISWSGPRSRAVAEALKKWLPMIVNAFDPWFSQDDIDRGARWSSEIAGRLSTAKAGIICLTPSNLSEPWILFEAGAISKTLERTYVCPLLIGLEPSDVTGPLSQFQATKATKDDLLPLLKTMNKGIGEGAIPQTQIEKAFELLWPTLEADLARLPSDGTAQRPHRTDRDLLEELVDAVRGKSANDTMLLMDAEVRATELSERLGSLQAELNMERGRSAEELRSLDAVLSEERSRTRKYADRLSELEHRFQLELSAERDRRAVAERALISQAAERDAQRDRGNARQEAAHVSGPSVVSNSMSDNRYYVKLDTRLPPSASLPSASSSFIRSLVTGGESGGTSTT